MDVPMPLVWGMFTLIMNFIPNIGAFIAGVPPTILALIELGLTEALIVAAGLIVIESLAGNLLTPLLSGHTLKISPFLVLASLLVWSFMFGLLGAFLAPVLTAMLLTLVRRLRLKPAEEADFSPGRDDQDEV
jgi:predicted PurR-regulated permease PerM